MSEQSFVALCKCKVAEYVNARRVIGSIKPEDVYVVWLCKTLQNNKALLSTPLQDGMYYELTYNGDKNELYFDAYRKTENGCIKLNMEGI